MCLAAKTYYCQIKQIPLSSQLSPMMKVERVKSFKMIKQFLIKKDGRL